MQISLNLQNANYSHIGCGFDSNKQISTTLFRCFYKHQNNLYELVVTITALNRDSIKMLF